MRQVVLDTETTGLDPAQGHRLVEIGAVELINSIPTGIVYHSYINPERDVPREAEAVHGLSSGFLREKPVFGEVVDEFLDFLGDAELIIHNASFDLSFINAELSYQKKPPIESGRVVDTLYLARQKHPSGPNSLDALCKRYRVDNSRRSKHGALLDSELLAEVYIELIGGRQQALALPVLKANKVDQVKIGATNRSRPNSQQSRLTEAEKAAHAGFIAELGMQSAWKHSKG